MCYCRQYRDTDNSRLAKGSGCGYGQENSIFSVGSSKRVVSCIHRSLHAQELHTDADVFVLAVRHVIQHNSISRKHMVISVSPVQPGDGV